MSIFTNLLSRADRPGFESQACLDGLRSTQPDLFKGKWEQENIFLGVKSDRAKS